MTHETHTAVNWLSRNQIVSILEAEGFGCYDTESTDDLKEILKEGIEDSSIPMSVIE